MSEFMHAVTAPRPGGPESLEWSRVARPEPRAGEVLVRVVAAGINRADIMQREGRYALPAGFTDILGLECSGEVVAVGEGATTPVGSQVCALLDGGGYAEYVSVPETQLLPIPAGVSVRDAAALPEAACTVWSNLFYDGRLSAGQSLLVQGGASGIGSFAVQLAHALGIGVFATVSSAKADQVLELGADAVVRYDADDLETEIRRLTAGRGVDWILDILGGEYVNRNIAVLAPDGQIAVIGLQTGRSPNVDLGVLLQRRGTIRATALRTRPAQQKAEIVHRVLAEVWPHIESGAVKPLVHEVFAMSDPVAAHTAFESSRHIGKVLLTT